MTGTQITDLTGAQLSTAIHGRDVSCREVMTAYLARIAEYNPAVNAIVGLRDPDVLLTEAAACDDELMHGLSRGWMHGMPQAIKDLAETKGLRTTFGSRLLIDWVPNFDTLMVARMKAAGCIVIGKTNVPEFGLGSHTFNDVYGVTRNAFDHSRSAGGSSGGAAVALAMHMLPVADGSDYMGSLRNPAAWNGVYGFRPSQGRVPSWPERDVYLAHLATEGPMARTVVDLALLLGVQAGYDPRCALSTPGRLDEVATIGSTTATLVGDVRGTRIGWLGDLGGHLSFEPGIIEMCERALRTLADLGCPIAPAALAMDPERIWEAWLVWRHMLVAANLAPLVTDPSRRELMKPEALWEIDRGLALTAAQVTHAAAERTEYNSAITRLLDDFDVLAIPTAQVWPFPVEQRWPGRIADREMDTYHRWMEVTTYAAFAGLPAISVPVGGGEFGLQMGMQLIGRRHGDVDLLRIAAAFERARQ